MEGEGGGCVCKVWREEGEEAEVCMSLYSDLSQLKTESC